LFPYIIRRFIHLVPTFVGATLLAFLVSQLVPGDFVSQRALEPNVRQETIDRMRSQFALDQPILVQYVRWMGNLVQGNLGMSFSSNQPVINVIRRPIQNSIYLALFAVVLLYVMAIPLGVFAAVRQYTLGDQAISAVSYFGLAIPNFFFAQVLILCIFLFRGFTREHFGYSQLVFPVAGMTSNGWEQFPPWRQFWDIMWHMIVPGFVVATSGIAGFTRVLRGQMIEYLGSDFIRTARAKGLGDRVVTYKHALRPAVIPFIAGIGGILPSLLGGAGLVEIVMAWPGIIPRLLEAITRQDIYVVLGFVVITSLLLMIGNLISDLLLAIVDPRIRFT
jgi:peptide/nickel transport system permease protein